MVLSEIITGLSTHNEFIFFNTYIHFIVGILIATAIYPFLSRKLKTPLNYAWFVFFPALFGSIFPDLMFIISTLVEHRSIYGLYEALSHGGEIYSAFHFGFPLILVVPSMFFIVFIVHRLFRKRMCFISWKILFMMMSLSLLSALLHIYLDGVGF